MKPTQEELNRIQALLAPFADQVIEIAQKQGYQSQKQWLDPSSGCFAPSFMISLDDSFLINIFMSDVPEDGFGWEVYNNEEFENNGAPLNTGSIPAYQLIFPEDEAALETQSDIFRTIMAFEYSSQACPGCGCLPGDGKTPGCKDPDGCGYIDDASETEAPM